MAAAEKKGDLFIKAPLVAVSTKGGAVKQMYFGDIVTEDVTKESVDLLTSLGFTSEDNPLDGKK